LLSVTSSEDTNLNVNVEQNIEGVPSYKTVTLAYNGMKTAPVHVEANASEVNT